MTFTQFLDTYNISLNEEQKEAAQTINGPCLLLAVPGSGKTTVLVTRLGYMIHGCDINPDDILTLTYTKAATRDMRERYIAIFGEDDKIPEFRTINGVCAKILIYYGRKLGRSPFEIEEEGARTKRIAGIYKDIVKTFASESDIQEISRLITYVKNMDLSEDEIKDIDKKSEYPFKKIYEAYNESMISDRVMDYDDQMLFAYRLIKSDPATLKHFREEYRYICVDEAQDTSKIQHMIISLLAGEKGNLFMVGDEDQSIYGFRAAYPEALLDFEKDHPGAKVHLMEENFRSNANIVYSADAFIQKNQMRHKKRMIAIKDAASEIRKINISTRSEQYGHILKAAEEGRETAVLYRDNESVLPLVDIFSRKGIPFTIRNAELTFFTNKVVLDIISVMRFIINPTDIESFLRFFYKLNLFLTKEEALKMIQNARGGSITEAGLKMQFARTNTAERFAEFAENVKQFRNLAPEVVLNSIITTMGYGNYLDKLNTGRAKTEILKSIFRNAKTIEEGLNRLEELSDIIRNNPNDPDCKTIFSTIHSSKGLEYDTVYILDAIDGIFPEKIYRTPSKLKGKNLAEYEENRRIFYVGITRAKNNLCLFKTAGGSSFVDDVKEVKKISTADKSEILARKFLAATVKSTMSYEEMAGELSEGRKVTHKKFGKGIVVGIKLPFVDIQFDDVRKSLNVEIMAKNGLLRL